KFGIAFLKTAWRMWKLRNSRFVADYEARAFASRNPIRRWWHRRRYRAVMAMVETAPRVLDLGCGSSMRVMGVPQAVGVDQEVAKLRYVKRLGIRGVRASLLRLPFPDASFDLAIAAQVLEHSPDDDAIAREIARVLKPNGVLVAATPDFSRRRWR